MEEILFENDLFCVTNGEKFLTSTLKDYPKSLESFHKTQLHSDLNEFHDYRKRVEGVLELLTPKTEEAKFIVYKNIKYLECTSCKLDIRFKYMMVISKTLKIMELLVGQV